ncbi:carboxypeptidase B-like [Cimex lectularius]|uniref:Peptidase M14 domain-containing protein n=1 Tax=Cimex lectularius TaxID=79782 RepID=A0A8I6RRQ2_CIMLE|nr:carboxypeptidase B-like [Cimex lectularius]
MMIFRLCLLVFAASFLAPHVISAAVATPRDISMVAAFFQWFETAMEMVFGYFMGSKPNAEKERKKGTTRESRVSYDNYHVLRVIPGSDQAVQELEMLLDEPGLDFWNPPLKNRTTDLLAPPDLADYLKLYLQEREIPFSVLTSNLQADMKNQNPTQINRSTQLKIEQGHPMSWERYHRYKDIEAYLDYLGKTASELVKIIKIGKSTEGRALKVVRVSSSKGKSANPAIWIDGGMHGREWIAPATALFILKQLVENYKTNRAVVDGIDWYIMPVANPDGYEYSHSTDRFWRKNRSKASKDIDDYDDYGDEARFFWDDVKRCEGVDLNRNFDFHWGEVGMSKNPCKSTYGGQHAFSEPESKAISDFIMRQGDQIKSYVTLHAYSQMILLPWGFTKQTPSDHSDLMYVGRKALDALQKVYGTNYEIGTSPTLLYPTSGSSDDWAKGKAGIKYSYTIELRDKGKYGFLLPASQILPTGRETFAAIKTIARHVTLE